MSVVLTVAFIVAGVIVQSDALIISGAICCVACTIDKIGVHITDKKENKPHGK